MVMVRRALNQAPDSDMRPCMGRRRRRGMARMVAGPASDRALRLRSQGVRRRL